MVNVRRQASESKFAEESVPKEESIRLSFRPLAVTLLAGPAAITFYHENNMQGQASKIQRFKIDLKKWDGAGDRLL